MVYGRHEPWQAQSEEHVDRVGPGDVPDGVVGMALAHGRRLGRERVGQGRAQGDKSDC